MEGLDAAIRKATCRGIEALQSSQSAKAFALNGGVPAEPVTGAVSVSDLRGSEPFEGGQQAGESGIHMLIANGAIRQATARDMDLLGAALARACLNVHLASAGYAVTLAVPKMVENSAVS